MVTLSQFRTDLEKNLIKRKIKYSNLNEEALFNIFTVFEKSFLLEKKYLQINLFLNNDGKKIEPSYNDKAFLNRVLKYLYL
jgi:hypothetical protein